MTRDIFARTAMELVTAFNLDGIDSMENFCCQFCLDNAGADNPQSTGSTLQILIKEVITFISLRLSGPTYRRLGIF